MALLSPKVIAQVNVRSTGDVGVMSWEWILRADGQVLYRLAKVDGRRERNEWTPVTQLPAGELEEGGHLAKIGRDRHGPGDHVKQDVPLRSQQHEGDGAESQPRADLDESDQQDWIKR